LTRAAIEVRHNAAAHRFEATVEGWLCVAAYTRVGNVMRIHHTEVPPAVGNRGIAAQIVRAAFAYAESHGLEVEPWLQLRARLHATASRDPSPATGGFAVSALSGSKAPDSTGF
jgi:predicted GNAT family acetyltransferase